MKKMIRSTLSLLMVLAVIMSLASVALAADSTATFKGKDEGFVFAPGSSYTESDLFDGFKDVMPGDKRTETITVTNDSNDSDYIKLYIRAEEHDEEDNPLSDNVANADETVVTMSEFLSQLSMKVWNGDVDGELIYDASPDELGGFEKNVYLGTVRNGETVELTVELDVPVEMGNKYQNRVGEVDWIFTAEMFDDPVPPVAKTLLTVHKIWEDDGENRPESVTVNLLRDGEVFAETTLNEDNQWTFTWNDLEEGYTWTAVEASVAEGYSASYKTEGNIVNITNTAEKKPDVPPTPPAELVELTVIKKWSGDEDSIDDRPESVKATLYNGSDAVETVLLGEWNNWKYTWENLDGNGDWKVIEDDVPKGYTPTYSADGDVITITNVASLVQTGQLKWPIPVLCGIGLAMIVFGGFIIVRKRKKDNV